MDHGAFDPDTQVTLAAFDCLTRQTQLTSDGVLPRAVRAPGFTVDGTRVPLIGPQRRFSRGDAGAIRVRRGR